MNALASLSQALIMKQSLPLYLALAILQYLTVKASAVTSEFKSKSENEDARLTARQLIDKYGYRSETHMVNTEDGYILGLHRITGPKSDGHPKGKQPVLMLHPLLGSSVVFLITGPRSLGYVMADEGYDVWLGNTRGNTFSRKHKKYTTLDKEYWQFSWHENGVQDLPAMIDYILKETNREQLFYVGHSQGNTAFWVMASERPEYQKKVKAMVALGPVAYLTHIRSPFYHVLAKYSDNIKILTSLLGFYEFEPSGQLMSEIKTIACDPESWSQPICTNIIFSISGPESDQLNRTMLPAIVAHVPAGGSVKQIIHYLQLIKAQRFQQYDYGLLGNVMKYRQRHPPAYDLSKIKIPVYLHYSSNDWFAVEKDVNRLYEELGDPTKYRVPHDEFSHLDFTWGKDSERLVFDEIVSQLKKHQD